MPGERISIGLDFPQLFEELTTGGIVIVDPFPDRDDDQVAFRTLIQLDGDVLFSIHRDALARDDFAKLLDAHQKHIRAVLEAKSQRLRLLASGFGVAFGIVGVGVAGASVGLGDITSFLQTVSVEWAITAAGSVGGLLLVALRRTFGEVGLRFLLRRWGLGQGRLDAAREPP